jgi:ADP-ribosylglycohydrolase
MMQMNLNRRKTVVNSALWAAYGDALGFITELTDSAGVMRRAKTDCIKTTMAWRRLIGGRFGGEVVLPAGCYSDDTQLRLSTCRSIRPDGSFDVDSFAKVELPVFDAYALGAGNSSKAAARALANPAVAWFSNFYQDGKTRYLDAGGNGALMRIQPHVWCERQPQLSYQTLHEIIRNVFCTHGHPRALAGALFHAFQLLIAVRERRIADPSEWQETVRRMESIPDIVRKDDQLNRVWLPTWEQKAGRKWDETWKDVLTEVKKFVDLAIQWSIVNAPLEDKYRQLVDSLDATSDAVRGEAVRTAILAQFLAWCSQRDSGAEAILIAVNALGTDTDTVASLVGAFFGTLTENPPPGEVLDRNYIAAQAARLDMIANGERVDHFQYPNILDWHPPRSQLDVVCTSGGKFRVSGLGNAREAGTVFNGRKKDEMWQILPLEFGQTVIIKRRARPFQCPKNEVSTRDVPTEKKVPRGESPMNSSPEQLQLGDSANAATLVATRPGGETMDEITSRLISQGFIPSAIGETLLRFAKDQDGLEKAVAFTAIMVKARRARLRKERGSSSDSE